MYILHTYIRQTNDCFLLLFFLWSYSEKKSVNCSLKLTLFCMPLKWMCFEMLHADY